MRVLVLGGTSYVAQFLLQRHLDIADDKAAANHVGAQESTAPAFVMGCTMRGDRDSLDAPLPAGFRSISSVELSSHATSSSEGARSVGDSDTHPSDVRVYWGVDLATMTGVRECVHHFRPDVVVNCIAMSSPAACEKAPERAAAINEPRRLVEFLAYEVDWDVRFVHFSTDFVYDGTTPPPLGYHEDDAGGARLTVYGASKLRFDDFLLAHPNSLRGFVLRIANVVGPQAPLLLVGAKQPPKFMEWLHRQLFCESTDASESGSISESDLPPLRLWSDEIRSYIYVRDLVEIVFALLARTDSLPVLSSSPGFQLFNIGGLDALSRVDLADKYCEAWQRAPLRSGRRAVIAPTSRATVDLGYHPPLDARLDITHLRQALPSLTLTPTDLFMDAIYRELATALALQ